jgi:sugar phosphate permease
MLSGPLSGLVLQVSNWHWMFLLGGLPAWLWAIVWWRAIPRSRDEAHWLPAGERSRLEAGLAAEHADFVASQTPSDWRAMLRYRTVWLLLGATCFNNMIFYGFGLWLPTMLKAASAMNISHVGFLNALPYLASAIGLIICTRSSDLRKERRLHAAIPMIAGGILLFLGSQTGWGLLQMAAFVMAGFTMYMTLPLISTLVTDILPSPLAIPAISMIGGVGNLVGGFAGAQIIGSLNQITGNFTFAFGFIAVLGVIGGFLILAVRPSRVEIKPAIPEPA